MADCLVLGQSFSQTLLQKGVKNKDCAQINHTSDNSSLITEEPKEEVLYPDLKQQADCDQRQPELELQRDCEQNQPQLDANNTPSEVKETEILPVTESEQFHKPTSVLQDIGPTDKMEAQTVVQTKNALPTMTDLESENRVAQEETTEPRVPDPAGEGDSTPKVGKDGSEQRLNGDAQLSNSMPDSNLEEELPNNNNASGKDASNKSIGGKSKRKEDKAIEHILKALNSLNTSEEKLAALCKKYADLHEEHRLQQTSHKQLQKKLQITTREKDQLQSEHNKAVMAKGKLESLCRELQKQNKLIKEESLSRAREEEERRKEVSAKFQNTISEIQTQMKDNHERNIKLKEENIELGHKLKNLVAQYETREEHIEKLMKHRDLETQLHEAKLQQAQCLLASEQEQNRKEREVVLLTMTETKKKSDIHEAQEKQLRSQLAMYTEKFDEFQTTLNKSNEVFGKFKTEMDKMSKRIKKLEKETAMWKGKWETSNKSLLEMADDKQRHDKEKAIFRAKIEKLESLCRALQAERRGKLPDENLPEVNLEAGIPDKEKTFDPTKTPPNTPDVPSRTSPETVQGAANGAGNGEAVSGEVTQPNTQADPIAPSQVSETEQQQLEQSAGIPTEDSPPQEVQVDQSDDSGAAQLGQPEPNNQSHDTAAAPASQSVQVADQPK